jgi:hypothetical protein
MSLYKRVDLVDVEDFLDKVAGETLDIEELSPGEAKVVGDNMRSLCFYEEKTASGKFDLLHNGIMFEFLYEDNEEIMDRINVYDNLVDTQDAIVVWDSGLKCMTVSVLKEPDDWWWVVVDFNTAYPNINDVHMEHEGNAGWKCDQLSGIKALLVSDEFRVVVNEWHGNYKDQS